MESTQKKDKRLRNMTYEERLKELGLFGLGEKG